MPSLHVNRRSMFFRMRPLQRIQMRAVAVIAAMAAALLICSTERSRADAPGFRAFVESLRPLAAREGVSRATFDRAFEGVEPDPAILAKARNQAEFVKPIGVYLSSAVSPQRIATGQRKMGELAPEIRSIASRYGVDPYVLVAIWGVESNFGSNCGTTSVIRDLATLAFARYRGDYFRKELLIALKILQEGHVAPSAMLGSWAGAMGQTQFMPSSFMRFAVAYGGSRRKNIWTNSADALASTANYLARHGWVRGWTWGYEVFSSRERAAGVGRTLAFSDWARLGYRRADGGPMPNIGRAELVAPAGPLGPLFLTTRNFSVIRTYNSSLAYALGVSLLSDRLAGEGPLKAAWPTTDDMPTASIAR